MFFLSSHSLIFTFMAEREPVDSTADLRVGRDRALTNGIAKGDQVVFEGKTYTVNGIETGGATGPRVRLCNDEGHRWVERNLVESVATVESAA